MAHFFNILFVLVATCGDDGGPPAEGSPGSSKFGEHCEGHKQGMYELCEAGTSCSLSGSSSCEPGFCTAECDAATPCPIVDGVQGFCSGAQVCEWHCDVDADCPTSLPYPLVCEDSLGTKGCRRECEA